MKETYYGNYNLSCSLPERNRHDVWHDREFDNECDCGYCSDHDEDGW